MALIHNAETPEIKIDAMDWAARAALDIVGEAGKYPVSASSWRPLC